MAQHLQQKRIEAICAGIISEKDSQWIEDHLEGQPIIGQDEVGYLSCFLESIQISDDPNSREDEVLRTIILEALSDRPTYPRISKAHLGTDAPKLKCRTPFVYGRLDVTSVGHSGSSTSQARDSTPNRKDVVNTGRKMIFKKKKCKRCSLGQFEKCERFERSSRKADIALEVLAKWAVQGEGRKSRRWKSFQVISPRNRIPMHSPLRHSISYEDIKDYHERPQSSRPTSAHHFLADKAAQAKRTCRREYGMYIMKGGKEAYVGERGVFSPGGTLNDVERDAKHTRSAPLLRQLGEEARDDTDRLGFSPASASQHTSTLASDVISDRCLQFLPRAANPSGNDPSSRKNSRVRRLRTMNSGFFVDRSIYQA